MTYLLVGGAGYIGSHIALELIKKNHKIIIFDNFSTENKESLHLATIFYQRDHLNLTQLEQVFKKEKIDVVIHLAASIIASESVVKPLSYYNNNLKGVLNILFLMKKYDVKNIIFSSTAAVYGNLDQEFITEKDITIPINPYGWSKLFAEKIIIDTFKQNHMNYGILRYFNVTGGASIKNEIGLFVNKHYKLSHLIPSIADYVKGKRNSFSIFGNDFDTKDGTCNRDYVHVVLSEWINKGNSDIFNVGSKIGYSVLEVLNTFEKVLNHKIDYKIEKIRQGDPIRLVASNNKVKQVLKFENQYDLKAIIKTELAWRKKGEKWIIKNIQNI